MLEIVSFIGVVGSGKNYAAKQLAKKGFVHVDFKDALLDMCSDLVGYDVRADYGWFKTHLVGIKRPPNRLMESYPHTDTRDWLKLYPEMMTGRKLLQRMGTEVMRKRDKSYWANQFYETAEDLLVEGKSVS